MSQRFPRLAAHVFNRAHWATPRFAENVAAVLMGRIGGTTINNVVMAGPTEQLEHQPVRSAMTTRGGIRVIPVVGGLAHRGDSFDAECYGMASYTHLHNQLVQAMDDPEVKGILLDIDSPGGEVGGCFELADTVLDMRKEKPIYGVANALAASAAYALGASCSKLFCTPSGEVGSIGVVWLHVDMSKNLEAQGIATTFVYAGKHKVDGNPFEPLSAADKKLFQEEIDASYGQFVALVAARRPMSPEAIRDTEARCFRADEAVKIGLADGVASFQAALDALESDLNQARRPGIVKMENPQMTTKPAEQPAVVDHAALEAARAEGRADGYKAGRADAAKIISSEHAAGRGPLAAKFAGDAAMSVEAATGYLAEAPQEAKGGALSKAMEHHKPNVSPVGENSPNADRLAQITAAGKAASSARYLRSN